ncbi:MAG: FtsW/RodA/SpoVE family cell cycle protein [Acutalibacteraceae bacterium]
MNRWRKYIAAAGVLLLCATLVLGTSINGAKNWIYIGKFSIQPGEFVKIAFIFGGAATLDRLQTRRNLTEFIIFGIACGACFVLMHDMGSAAIFFITFLLIAFMRSGSLRTVFLATALVALGLFMFLQLKPYAADRFSIWGHVWDDVNGLGYQQSRTLTYIASGGLFGVGLGRGYLVNMPEGNSDLVFGMLCEEQGLLLSFIVLLAIVLFIFYARSDVTRSRSTFYSITACAAAGLLLFQTALNVLGPTDILPLTGVTLPWISAGGSSMMAVWGLLAFIKASDERTYAARRKSA